MFYDMSIISFNHDMLENKDKNNGYKFRVVHILLYNGHTEKQLSKIAIWLNVYFNSCHRNSTIKDKKPVI